MLEYLVNPIRRVKRFFFREFFLVLFRLLPEDREFSQKILILWKKANCFLPKVCLVYCRVEENDSCFGPRWPCVQIEAQRMLESSWCSASLMRFFYYKVMQSDDVNILSTVTTHPADATLETRTDEINQESFRRLKLLFSQDFILCLLNEAQTW